MSDIKLTFINNSNDLNNSSIVIFQQDPSQTSGPGGLPLAWKVFPLQGPQQEVFRQGLVVYTAAQSIEVTRNPQPYDPMPYGILEIFRSVNSGDQTAFSIDQYGALSLTLLPDKGVDGTFSCTNQSTDTVSMSFYKSGSPLMTTTVFPQQTVVFSIPSKLYAACTAMIQEGGTSQMVLVDAPVQELDLTHCTEITLTLQDAPNGGKSWTIERL